MQRLKDDLAEFGIVEQEAKMEGRQLTMVLAPGKKKKVIALIPRLFVNSDSQK
jgi:hypothetical protein